MNIAKNMKLLAILILLLLVVLPLFATAQVRVDGPGATFDRSLGLVSDVFTMISKFFAMDWLFNGNPQNIIGFFRFMVWLTIFTILQITGQNTVAKMFEEGGKRMVTVVAIVIATITIILVPMEVIFGWGQAVSVIMMLVLIGFPIVGLIYLAYSPDMLDSILEGWALRLTRIVIILICWELTHLVGAWGFLMTDSLVGQGFEHQFVNQVNTAIVFIGSLLIIKKNKEEKKVEE